MNKIYWIISNQALEVCMVVVESPKGHSKSPRSNTSAKRRLGLAALVVGLVTGSAGLQMANAAPAGGQVTSGVGSINQIGNTTTINQSTQNLSLNWKSFHVGTSETVNFVQPSANAIAVNRIFDTNGSQILGNLNANGQVFLINPNGVIFGAGAQVNVGGLVASTLDTLSSTGSTTSFVGAGTGSVINLGKITATNGGYVALLGNHVSNQGVISAQRGTVGLGAGSAVTLSFNGSSMLHMVVDQSKLNSLAENGGLVQADAGQVLMTAGAANSLLASVVNNTGVIEARTVNQQGGTITLLGGMQNGTVNVAGTLDASASNGGNGGFIETSAAHVQVASGAKTTTAADTGVAGTWLIDPTDFTISAGTGGSTTSSIGALTLGTSLGSGNVVISTSVSGSDPGDINVNAAVSWSANTLTLNAQNNININANLNGSAAAKLSLEYGQGAVSSGNISTYNLNNGAQVNLAAGLNFSTLLGSDGTPTNYTVITSLGPAGSATATDLQGIAGGRSGHYVLGTNINASATASWNAGQGFDPIGYYWYSSYPFIGTFDGLGHTISGLTINRPSAGNVGLFGYTNSGAIIRNVGLVGGSMVGGNTTGSLVGTNNGTATVSNSYATSNVTGTYSVGGLVGGNYGSIIDSYATGSVNGTNNWVGGLAGRNYGNNSTVIGSVINSYATGNVTGGSSSSFVGGLLGSNDLTATLSKSYATGIVSGTNEVGGLVGHNGNTITQSYATGQVTGTGNDAGGLVGRNSGGTVGNSYASGTVYGNNNAGGLVGWNVGGTGGSSYSGSTGSNGASASITKSYATGAVTSTGNYAGGLVGLNAGGQGGAGEDVFYPGELGGTGGTGGVASVTDSFSSGVVSGSGFTGILIGSNSTGSQGSTGYMGEQTATPGAGGLGGQATQLDNNNLDTTAMKALANFSNWSIANTGASGAIWRIYEGNTAPLLTSFMTSLTLTDAPDSAVTYNGNIQNGATSAQTGILGARATGVNAGFYNGYYSTQQGYDISGGNLAINAAAPSSFQSETSRVMTLLATHVFSPQASVQPILLSIAPAITVTQTNSFEVADSSTESSSNPDTVASANTKMVIDSTAIPLQVVNGGVRLPGIMVQLDE